MNALDLMKKMAAQENERMRRVCQPVAFEKRPLGKNNGGQRNPKNRKPKTSLDLLLTAVSMIFDCNAADLWGKSQSKSIFRARAVAMLLARQELNMSFEAIGIAFNRDHTTAISAIRSITKKDDPHLQADILASAKLYQALLNQP